MGASACSHSTGGLPRQPAASAPSRRRAWLWLGVAAATAAAVVLGWRSRTEPGPAPPVTPQKQDAWEHRIEPALADADARTSRAVDHSIRTVRRFFRDRQTGSRPFAEAMLSLPGKWALVRSRTPPLLGGDDQAHLQYLNARFSKLVFSDIEFRQVVESAVAGYLGELQAAENDLLVRIRADVADIPLESLPAARSDEFLRSEFDRVARQMAPAIARELGVDAVREMSSFVAGEIAATVMANLATRLGLSSGMMAAGVSTSWATFGLSIVAAIVADQVVCWVYDEVRDPAGDLAARINVLLADISRLVTDGDGRSPGLRGQLTTFDEARSRVRRAALEQLILGHSPPGAATQPADPRGSPLRGEATPGR